MSRAWSSRYFHPLAQLAERSRRRPRAGGGSRARHGVTPKAKSRASSNAAANPMSAWPRWARTMIFVRADSRRMPMDIYLSKKQYPDVKDGEKVVVRIADWAEGSKKAPWASWSNGSAWRATTRPRCTPFWPNTSCPTASTPKSSRQRRPSTAASPPRRSRHAATSGRW